MNSEFFKPKRKIIKFLSKRNIFQFGKYFSPRAHDCLNNIEMILFISFYNHTVDTFLFVLLSFAAFFDAGKL